MPSLRRSLPTLSALTTFEVAARLGSFTRAAAELGVTQAAVSRQIRALEIELGVRLFIRSHRQVTLTRAGTQLATSVSSSFDRIAETIYALRQTYGAGTVTIGATLAFSHFWLLPRLSGFRRASPGIQMRLISQDEAFDMEHDDAQIVIRYGTPPFQGSRVLASLPDRIFPVCSRALLDRFAPTAAEVDLFSMPLIATDWNDPAWSTWGTWAEAAGLGRRTIRPALRFTHYTDTVYAAMNGEGVALGWEQLLRTLFAEGKLVRVGQEFVGADGGYHVLVREAFQPDEQVQRVVDWVADEFAAAAFA